MTYYSDNAIRITSEWVKLGGRSYRLSDLTSVKLRSTQVDPLRDAPTLLGIIGSILMFALLNLQYLFPSDWEGVVQVGAFVGMLLAVAGLVMLVVGMLVKTDCLYFVQLAGSFGRSCPFASDDEEYVRSVVEAIRQALAERQSEVSASQVTMTETAQN